MTNKPLRDTRAAPAKGTDVIYRIPLSTEMKKTDLPPVHIWDSLESSNDNLKARLPVRVRSKGIFFDSTSSTRWRSCILSPKGYLVVYVKEEQLRGYALDVSLAKKIEVVALKEKHAEKKGYVGTEKGYVCACIKWSSGSLRLLLAPEIAHSWTTMLFAFQVPQSRVTPTLPEPLPLALPAPVSNRPCLEPVPNTIAEGSPSSKVATAGDSAHSDREDRTMMTDMGADFWTGPTIDWSDLESVRSAEHTIKPEPSIFDFEGFHTSPGLPKSHNSLILVPSVTILSVGPEQLRQISQLLAAVDSEEDDTKSQ